MYVHSRYMRRRRGVINERAAICTPPSSAAAARAGYRYVTKEARVVIHLYNRTPGQRCTQHTYPNKMSFRTSAAISKCLWR
eukprot:3039833-Pleurochrysis_carterae.AAC.1